jgi:hypothetical protein
VGGTEDGNYSATAPVRERFMRPEPVEGRIERASTSSARMHQRTSQRAVKPSAPCERNPLQMGEAPVKYELTGAS